MDSIVPGKNTEKSLGSFAHLGNCVQEEKALSCSIPCRFPLTGIGGLIALKIYTN